MNARTDIPVVADARVVPAESSWDRFKHRCRWRLRTWRRPLQVMLTGVPQPPGQATALAAVTQAFEAWAATRPGAVVELSLSAHVLLTTAHSDASEAPGLPHGGALREWAIDRWAHYLDMPADGFESAWRVQTTRDASGAPVALACAVPQVLVDDLCAVAHRHGLKLLALKPWWADGLEEAWQALPSPSSPSALETEAEGGDEAHRPTRHWAWREGDWQTQATVTLVSGRWVLRSLALVANDPTGASVPNVVLTDLGEAGLGGPVAVSSLPSPLPSPRPARRPFGWAESLNFVGPRVRVSFWSWALLACAAIALVHALDLSAQVDGAQELAEAERARLQAHVGAATAGADVRAPVSASSVAPSVPGDGPPPLSPESWPAAAQLAAWLGHPWAAALDHADASAHQRGIALTRFQVDLGTWGNQAGQPLNWRLQAVVPDDATALDWMKALGPQAELQRRDALAQPVVGERGSLVWRVDVGTQGAQR